MKKKENQSLHRVIFWKELFYFSLLFCLMGVNIKQISLNPSLIKGNPPEITESPNSPSNYVVVDPIMIGGSSNLDWTNYSFITGAGTPEDPYIIEGIEIIGNASDFENEPDNYGIYIWESSVWVIIRDCYIHNFHVGIWFGAMMSDSMHIIERNIIENCGLGMYILGDNFTITQNQISECHAMEKNLLKLFRDFDLWNVYMYGGAGIYVHDLSVNVNLTLNIISRCDIGFSLGRKNRVHDNQLFKCGILLDTGWSYLLDLKNNSVNGFPLGFFTPFNFNQTEGEPLIFDGNVQLYGQLIVLGLENVEIKNMNIQDTTLGYQIVANYNLSISNCTADGCLFGMHIRGRSPSYQNITQYEHITGVRIKNCLIGIQAIFRDISPEGFNYNVSVDISEFLYNDFDILLAFESRTIYSITVPINSTVYFDYYDQSRLQVTFNGSLLNSTDPRLQNQSSVYSDALNATVLHLNQLGQYHIIYDLLVSPYDWHTWHNVSITVVELSLPLEHPSIGVYMGFWFSSAFGIGLVCILIYMKKRRSLS